MSKVISKRVRARRSPPLTGGRLRLCLEHYPELERVRLLNQPLKAVYADVEKKWRSAWPEDFVGAVAYSKERTKSNKASKLRPDGAPKPVRERIEEWFNNHTKRQNQLARLANQLQPQMATSSNAASSPPSTPETLGTDDGAPPTVAAATIAIGPAGAGTNGGNLKIFNRQQKKLAAWMYWSKGSYDVVVKPFVNYDTFLQNLADGEPRWDSVTYRNKVTEFVYLEQDDVDQAITEEYKRLYELRIEDLIADEASAAETTDDEDAAPSVQNILPIPKDIADDMSEEDIRLRTLDLINKIKNAGPKPKAKASKPLPPLTSAQLAAARERVIQEKLVDREWATTAMTNTLYRGTKTLSDASGWLSFFVAGGPRLMGDGQVHVEVSFGGPDNKMSFEEYDPAFFDQFRQKFTGYVETYYDDMRRERFGHKMALQFPGLIPRRSPSEQPSRSASPVGLTSSRGSSARATPSRDAHPLRQVHTNAPRQYKSKETVDTSDEEDEPVQPARKNRRRKQRTSRAGRADAQDTVMEDVSDSELNAQPGAGTKRRASVAASSSVSDDAGTPQPRPRMRKRAKVADAKATSTIPVTQVPAVWDLLRAWATSGDEGFNLGELEGEIVDIIGSRYRCDEWTPVIVAVRSALRSSGEDAALAVITATQLSFEDKRSLEDPCLLPSARSDPAAWAIWRRVVDDDSFNVQDAIEDLTRTLGSRYLWEDWEDVVSGMLEAIGDTSENHAILDELEREYRGEGSEDEGAAFAAGSQMPAPVAGSGTAPLPVPEPQSPDNPAGDIAQAPAAPVVPAVGVVPTPVEPAADDQPAQDLAAPAVPAGGIALGTAVPATGNAGGQPAGDAGVQPAGDAGVQPAGDAPGFAALVADEVGVQPAQDPAVLAVPAGGIIPGPAAPAADDVDVQPAQEPAALAVPAGGIIPGPAAPATGDVGAQPAQEPPAPVGLAADIAQAGAAPPIEEAVLPDANNNVGVQPEGVFDWVNSSLDEIVAHLENLEGRATERGVVIQVLQHLREVENAPADWILLLRRYALFEWQLGFPAGGDLQHKLGTSGRPGEVAAWIKRHRSLSTVPASVERETYGEDVRRWYTNIMPSWRQGGPFAWPLCRRLSVDHSLEPVRKGGQNGVVMLIIATSWWLRKGPNRSQSISLVEDLAYVVDDLTATFAA